MKTAFKLAYRNLIGAGLRTWLNVIVLSFSFVVIIWLKGILMGWDYQAKSDMTNWEIGGGQYWHESYDPYDPFTLAESHSIIPQQFSDEIEQGDMVPVLMVQGTIYPQGRMQSITIKGIDPDQDLFLLPTHQLDTATDAVPAIIGAAMAESLQLDRSDHVTLRWRDARGTFDATDIVITDIFSSNVPSVEAAQVYIPLAILREMTMMQGEATLLTFRDPEAERPAVQGWVHKPKEVLTASVDRMIKTKTAGQSVFYTILLLLAMLAIFDTQVLSIFRRQKEIGTYIALGYTRREVVGLFTVEGAMHSIFAAVVGALYGLPFLAWQAEVGWTIPMDAGDFGMAMAQTLYPVYSAGLVISTVLIVVVITTVVSYWPSRKIAKMNPTEALRGRIQ
ncbi:MAG: FtsX-like permease family protein [Prolixibacteraceae bacterium]|jgi:ABC-type lipoprotein release transport system permease subunit|nr:FtsX-like permease family protein [Prolixibacteraceae bacterium]MDD4755840.1 FtsX-like permease family protein [Prolixibacteraceae bacterium]NLO03565.1 FtsX-like permease family protein [Bacteroidales bacterium]